MKLSDCVNTLHGLGMASDKKLGVKTGYAVAININRLSEVVKPFEEERDKLVKDLREKHSDKDGNIDEKEALKAEKKVQELLDEKVDIKLMKLKLDDIPEEAGLTPSFFALCKDVIEE
jgi:hypothetical protein